MRTAQNLNSGILPNGARAALVKTLAAASLEWEGVKTLARMTAALAGGGGRGWGASGGGEPDGAGPRAPRHFAAVRQSQPRQVLGMHFDKRSRLQGIENLGPPRHRARVPMLQEPPGIQHEGEFVVGQLVGRRVFARNEFAAAAGRRKAVAEEHGCAVARRRIGAGPDLAHRAEVIMR